MKRLAAITKRLFDEASPDKDTDTKMEDGSTMEWVAHSEADVSWLLKRIDDLVQSGRQIVDDLDARIDNAPDSAKPVFRGLAEMHAAIHKTINANDRT